MTWLWCWMNVKLRDGVYATEMGYMPLKTSTYRLVWMKYESYTSNAESLRLVWMKYESYSYILHTSAVMYIFQNLNTAINKSTASTALCLAAAFTSSKWHNSVKNKMCSTCYVPLYFFKTSRKPLKLFSSYRKGTHTWLGWLLTMFKGQKLQKQVSQSCSACVLEIVSWWCTIA